MTKLLIFIFMTVGGWLGWWLGARFGFGVAFALSGVGSLAGVYAGWRIAQDHF